MNEIHSRKKPLRVKLLAKCSGDNPGETWGQFLPYGNSLVGSCQFVFDPQERNYDWLVVYDDLPSMGKKQRFTHSVEPLACSRKNTLLVTTEPISIKTYGTAYPSQFGHVLTSQEEWALQHPNVIRSQPALIWFYGRSWSDIARCQDYEKTKTISTVCSSKQQKHTLHHYRYRLTQELRQTIPELSVYGHGVRPMDYKWESLEPYTYHIAIENHAAQHHWTEKLADAFLGLTLPFYYGCPNIVDYFPEDSFIPIDLFNAGKTAEIIRESIQKNAYEKRKTAIAEARRRVLEEYGLFSVLSHIISERHLQAKPEKGEAIESRHALRKSHPLKAVYYGWERLRARCKSSKQNRNLAKGL